jgi:hypothetical protein
VKVLTIQSSNIDHVGYLPLSEELYIQFSNGTWYRYDEVMPDVVLALLLADSPGSFLAKHIKGVYECEKIEEPAGVHV